MKNKTTTDRLTNFYIGWKNRKTIREYLTVTAVKVELHFRSGLLR